MRRTKPAMLASAALLTTAITTGASTVAADGPECNNEMQHGVPSTDVTPADK